MSSNAFANAPQDPETQRQAFWQHPEFWPADTDTHMFLARVIDLVGKTIHGPEWLGEEPAVIRVQSLPSDYTTDVSQFDKVRACRYLYQFDEGYRSRCPSYAEVLDKWPIPTADEWSRAGAGIAQIVEESRARAGRFWDICHRLSLTFKRGHIQTALRPVAGGKIVPQDPALWNTENYWGRFECCRVDLSDPFSGLPQFQGGHFLFVERESLFAALTKPEEPASQQSAEPIPASDVTGLALSPYLICMIEATKALIKDLANPPKKVELAAQLRKFWPGNADDLTDQDIKSMATLMRLPESKKGRAAKRATPEGKP